MKRVKDLTFLPQVLKYKEAVAEVEELLESQRTTLREQIEGLRRASGDQDRYNMAIFDVLSLLAHEEGK